MEFTYSWESPAARNYELWLKQQQQIDIRRRKIFSLLSWITFVLGIAIPAVVIFIFDLSPYFWIISPFFIIAAGVLATDDVKGKIYFDFVGAVIYQFSTLNEFSIGKFERQSMMIRHDVEEQRLLYCLRVSSNVKKYKKTDVIISQWKGCMEHGAPYFFSTPRGKLVYDFLSQLYLHRMKFVLQEYAKNQLESLSKLKTTQAKECKIAKIQETLQEIADKGYSLPGLIDFINELFS